MVTKIMGLLLLVTCQCFSQLTYKILIDRNELKAFHSTTELELLNYGQKSASLYDAKYKLTNSLICKNTNYLILTITPVTQGDTNFLETVRKNSSVFTILESFDYIITYDPRTAGIVREFIYTEYRPLESSVDISSGVGYKSKVSAVWGGIK